MDGDDDEEVAAVLAAARAGFDAIRARDDDPAKFKAVSELAEGFRKLWEQASVERREVVTRIRDKGRLALAPLAQRVGMSKTRLHQLISADKGREHAKEK
ncbi:MAG TPA: hypothetical protein VFQ68_42120 [Streptosporangiaceae bacterium]|nr:hypothetical protein [Streptosporangiaceae bacterium]